MRRRIEHELGEVYHLARSEQPMGVTVVFGGQAGSEGKGAIVGYLARRWDWGAAVCTFMPNAGHTWKRGATEVVVSQLPQALVSRSVQSLMIGASSVIDLDQLGREIDEFDPLFGVESRLRIHPRAQIMLPEYKEWEAEHLRYIASTGKGCGAAIAAKARREQGVKLAKDEPILKPYIDHRFDLTINDMINSGRGVLVEQSQGFDLDINHGVSYPYCTSRQCTPTQIMADVGVDGRMLTNSIAVVRTRPIRVGNVEGGHSGEYGSQEIDWQSVSAMAGRHVEERTTVTKRVRRVFEFDFHRIGVMSAVCRPTHIALTFCDYLDKNIFGKTQEDFVSLGHNMKRFSQPLFEFIYELESAVRRPTMNPSVKLIKTGPDDAETINLGWRP